MRTLKTLLGAAALTATALMIAPTASRATVVSFDFSQLNGGSEGLITPPASGATQVTTGSPSSVIVARGTSDGSAAAPLWVRNVANDHGIGVCTSLEAAASGGCGGTGDRNELSNELTNEAIYLTNLDTGSWTSLWVSSLDNGGSGPGGAEGGTLYYSATNDFTGASSFNFKWGDFGSAAEGDILTLAAASGFVATDRFLKFTNNVAFGTNNDYLVWKGTANDVPEPTTLVLFGAGLVGASILRRRRRAAAAA